MQRNYNLSIQFVFIMITFITYIMIYKSMLFTKSQLALDAVIFSFYNLKLLQSGNFFQKEIKNLKQLILNLVIVGTSVLLIIFMQHSYVMKFSSDLAYAFWFDTGVWIRLGIYLIISFIFSCWHYATKERTARLEIKSDSVLSENRQQEAELTKLRQQINPHFLFNSLNSINALIQFDTEGARKMIVNLSKYYRNTINTSENTWLPLENELNDIQLYFEIEKIRFGHRLSLTIDTIEGFNNILVPPLLFQPLVENAIKHGLYETLGHVNIHIKLYKTYSQSGKEFLTFEINNPFDHTTKSKPQGTGFGINNIKKRLYVLFGSEQLFQTKIQTTDEQNALFTAFISLPQNELK